MKKTILFTMLLAMCAMFWRPVMAADITGQDKYMILTDLLNEFYDEVALFTTAKHRVVDSTTAIRILNNTMNYYACLYNLIERDTVVLIVAGTEKYALPSDCHKIESATSIAGGSGDEEAMLQVSYQELGLHRDATGTPAFFAERKSFIHIVPANTSNDSVLVYYHARSNVLSANTDTSNVDVDYKTLIVLRAAESTLRGKNPSLGDIGKSMLDDITLRRAEQEALMFKLNKTIFETITK